MAKLATNQPDEGGEGKQGDNKIQEHQKEAETVRLLAKRDDVLASIPGERKPEGKVVVAQSRRNGGGDSRSSHQEAQFQKAPQQYRPLFSRRIIKWAF